MLIDGVSPIVWKVKREKKEKNERKKKEKESWIFNVKRGNTNLFHCEETVDFIVVCVEKVEKKDLVY